MPEGRPKVALRGKTIWGARKNPPHPSTRENSAQITKIIITFQRGRFGHRSLAGFKAHSTLHVIHTQYSNNSQRKHANATQLEHRGRAAAASPQIPPLPTGLEKLRQDEDVYFWGVPCLSRKRRDTCRKQCAPTSSTLPAFQRRRDRGERCPGCRDVVILVPGTCWKAEVPGSGRLLW